MPQHLIVVPIHEGPSVSPEGRPYDNARPQARSTVSAVSAVAAQPEAGARTLARMTEVGSLSGVVWYFSVCALMVATVIGRRRVQRSVMAWWRRWQLRHEDPLAEDREAALVWREYRSSRAQAARRRRDRIVRRYGAWTRAAQQANATVEAAEAAARDAHGAWALLEHVSGGPRRRARAGAVARLIQDIPGNAQHWTRRARRARKDDGDSATGFAHETDA